MYATWGANGLQYKKRDSAAHDKEQLPGSMPLSEKQNDPFPIPHSQLTAINSGLRARDMNSSADSESRERAQQHQTSKPTVSPLATAAAAVEGCTGSDRLGHATPPRSAYARPRKDVDFSLQTVHDADYWLQKGASPLQPHSATPSPRKARIFSRDVDSPSPVEEHGDTVMSIRELDVVEEEHIEEVDRRLEMDDLRVADIIEQPSHQLSPSPLKKKPRHSPTHESSAVRRKSIPAASTPPSSFECTTRRLSEMSQNDVERASVDMPALAVPKTPLLVNRDIDQIKSPTSSATVDNNFVDDFRKDLVELRSPIKRVTARASPKTIDTDTHMSGTSKVDPELPPPQIAVTERSPVSPQKGEIAHITSIAESKQKSPGKSSDGPHEPSQKQNVSPTRRQLEEAAPVSDAVDTLPMSGQPHSHVRASEVSPEKLANGLDQHLHITHHEVPVPMQSPIATAAEKGHQVSTPMVDSPLTRARTDRHSALPNTPHTVHVTPVKNVPFQQPDAASAKAVSSGIAGTPAPFKASLTTPRQSLHPQLSQPRTSAAPVQLHPEVYSHEVGQTSSLVDRDLAALNPVNTDSAPASGRKAVHAAAPQQSYLMTPMRPSAVAQQYQQSTAFDAKFMAEFDPLIPATTVVPNDWFMRFETPEAAKAAVAAFSPAPNQSPSAMRAAASAAFGQFAGQPASLLDAAIELPSPRSIFKYSDKDVERMKATLAAASEEKLNSLRKQLNSEFEESKKQMEADFALLEADFENRLQAQRLEAQEALKLRIAGWERHTNQIMAERAQESDRAAQEQERMQTQINDLMAEKDRMAKEFDVLEIKHMQQRMDTKDMRAASERLTQHLEEANKKLEKANEDYHKLMANAQDTIAQANAEIARASREHEKEISIATARTQKFEAKFNSAAKALLSKDEEIKQLSALCDELVQNMERGASR
ncbi:hypothetical protein HDU86_002323 [Geranomyces michiganensis]|nr:hypothetical protein HDU86_002323 [Geranomyces michiganensis]